MGIKRTSIYQRELVSSWRRSSLPFSAPRLQPRRLTYLAEELASIDVGVRSERIVDTA